MQNLTTDKVLDLAQQAKHWPTVAELVEDSPFTGRTIRRAIQDGELPAIRLDYLRVNPEDFAAWLAARQK